MEVEGETIKIKNTAGTAVNRVQEELEKSSLKVEQQHFVWQWVRREINLVAR
jgi:hypothetical protein